MRAAAVEELLLSLFVQTAVGELLTVEGQRNEHVAGYCDYDPDKTLCLWVVWKRVGHGRRSRQGQSEAETVATIGNILARAGKDGDPKAGTGNFIISP